MKFGLKDETLSQICDVFRAFPEVDEATIYGSRAKGTYKNGSDIDVTLRGDKLNLTLLNQIRSRLDDLSIPQTFDLSIFSQIDNEDLLDHIARVGKQFYKKAAEPTRFHET